MKKKIEVAFFLRKPIKNFHYSIELFYRELLTLKHKNIKIFQKKLPLYSKGILNRIYLIFWAFFNQKNINHISGDINFISLILKKKKNILTILDLYSLHRLKGLKRIIFKFLWLYLPIKYSSIVITISDNIKTEILKNFNISKNNIKVIPCFASKIFKKNYKKINLKSPKILIIGTGENKNFKRAIQSLKGLNLKLYIVGELNIEKINLLKSSKVIYKNYINLSQEKIYEIYKKIDILFYPSTYEGFGIPILEAQSVGRLVITSNINPLKNTAGKGAIFINPLSIKDMKNKILRLNQKKVKKCIKFGFKNVKKYNLSTIQNKYIEVYKSFYENTLYN